MRVRCALTAGMVLAAQTPTRESQVEPSIMSMEHFARAGRETLESPLSHV